MADDYFDRANRREVYLHRFATHLVNEYTTPNLQSAYKAARLILLDAEEITSNTQLNKITAAISREIKLDTELMWNEVTGELEDMAVAEAAFQAKMFKDVMAVNLDVPADKKILGYIDSVKMKLEGSKLNAWEQFTRQNANSIVDRYAEQIRIGMGEQETVNQMVKRLRNVTNTVLRNEAESLSRTGMSHYSINAREAMARDNESVITGRYFNSVFDNRRTKICTGYAAIQDGMSEPWGINDPTAPILPLHFNERSNWLFLVNNQKRPEGTRQAVGGIKTKEAEDRFNRRKEALAKRRANPDIEGETTSQVKYRGRGDKDTFRAGQIAGDTLNDSWYMGQPRYWLDDALGKGTAQLFVDGKIELKNIINFAGKPLTLKQLKAKYDN